MLDLLVVSARLERIVLARWTTFSPWYGAPPGTYVAVVLPPAVGSVYGHHWMAVVQVYNLGDLEMVLVMLLFLEGAPFLGME